LKIERLVNNNNKQASRRRSRAMMPLSSERSSGGCMVSGRSHLSQIASAMPVLLLVLHLVLLPRSSVVMGLPDADVALSRARIHDSPRGAAAADEDCGLWIPQSHLGDTNDDPLLFQPSLDDDDGTNRPPFGGLSIPKSLRLHSPAAAAAAAAEEQQHQEENDDTVATGTSRRRNWSSLSGVTKTGTTIVGVRTSSGVVLAADTRATEGSLVADMTCEKLQRTYKGRRIVWVAFERKEDQ
jgi:Proteasome subunit